MTHSIGIYIFDDVEALDFCGPFEVFSTACRVKARLHPDNSNPFEVFTIADTVRTVKARGGLKVQPHFDITNNPTVDVLIIPGGVISSELKRDNVIGWISKTAATSTITASVCTGAFLLGKAGLLRKKTVTTHWADIDELRAKFPETTVQENIRWIDTGSIITSGGISAGMDTSLHLVSRLEGEDLAVRIARQMEYNWQRLS